MLSSYQLKIVDFYNYPIATTKKLMLNFFDKEKYVLHYENLKTLFQIRIEDKKNSSRIRIQSIKLGQTICRIQHTKKNRSRKKW